MKETAEILKISPETVQRDWKFAKSWLRRELSGEHSTWKLSVGGESSSCTIRRWSGTRAEGQPSSNKPAPATGPCGGKWNRCWLKRKEQAIS